MAIAGSLVRVYCSAPCQQASGAPGIEPPVDAQRRSRWPHVVGVTVGLGLLALGGSGANDERPAPATVAVAPTVIVAPVPAVAPEVVAQQQRDDALVAELMKDVWFHPLAGPTRRMPRNHSQAFGAERPGDRPAECASGHCGVDVGGSLWGEPVRAAHDGIVDRVNRGPNEDRGGIYVRIAHRDRTVFTEYFHLAAVPRWISADTVVKAGQVIGLLGDTGVKHSAPHLHFAMSVKPSATAPERYLDPEPLLAIWPLWIPDEAGGGVSGVSTHEPPGLPSRARGRRRGKKPAPADLAPEAPAVAPETEPAAEPAADPAPPVIAPALVP